MSEPSSRQEREVVLITGASGFVGRALGSKLAPHFDVIGLDRRPPRRGAAIRHLELDLTSRSSIDSALREVASCYGNRLASVVHLAAHRDASGEPNPLHEEVTVQGTDALFAGLAGFEVEQFVYASSVFVHAPSVPGAPLVEGSPLAPHWDYPRSKARAEDLVRSHRGRLPFAIARLPGVYDAACHWAPLAQQIQRIYERRLLGHIFPGELEHGQTMVHLDDAANALALLVARRRALPPDLTLLVGEEKVMSYGEIQRALGRLIHGEEWETRSLPKSIARAGAWLHDRSPGDHPLFKPWIVDRADEHFEIDTTRARRVLGWFSTHSLPATLPPMIAFLHADPTGFYRDNGLELPEFLQESGPPDPPSSHAYGA